MPIIGNVEKKSIKVKILNLAIHLLLLIGAVTMIYPLLIMVSGSLKSDVDFSDFSIAPEYVYDNKLLFQKHLLTKYNNKNSQIFVQLREPMSAMDNVAVPENLSRVRYNDYIEFLGKIRKEKPHYWRFIGMASETGVDTLTTRQYRAWVAKKFENVEKFNAHCKTSYDSLSVLMPPTERFESVSASTAYNTPILQLIKEFKNTLPDLQTYYLDLDAEFAGMLRRNVGRELATVNQVLKTDFKTWQEVTLPVRYPAKNPAFAKVWSSYVKEDVNFSFLIILPSAKAEWAKFLAKKYHNLADLNRVYKGKFKSFNAVPLSATIPADGQSAADWRDFMTNFVSPRHVAVQTLAQEYRNWLKKKYGTLAKLNKAYDTGYGKFSEVILLQEAPESNVSIAKDMLAFMNTLSVTDLGLKRTALVDFRAFVAKKYTKADKSVDFKKLSNDYHHTVNNRFEIPFFTAYPQAPETAVAQNHFTEFIKDPRNARARLIAEPAHLQKQWEKFLTDRYGTIDKLNKSWGLVATDWSRIAPPIKEFEWFNMLNNRGLLIKEYLKRNYVMVIDTIITNGNAAKNTLLYCFLAVLATLTVNPLCAYALSRYKMAPSYKILLFLMLPMAFPAMVLGIPQFLLIKELGLLNTFAALILPGMANGYSIFLLKGFFDSLPKELFESAAIDGASEWTVFWHIAMGLSTPILSVIALSSFTAAYGNFMMAFLLCQDKGMWTMMVYLYQLQQRASQAVGFAALIIAAVPTLLVFIFCQNIIIKGIVVPTEK